MPSEVTRPLVLIADPDPECSALMARQLEWAGYGVLTTGFDAEAIELIEERRPDALIVEATLPERSGYTLVRELRSQPHNRLMPILMVSARAGKLDRDFAFTSGADDYVKKPFRCADIVSRLAYLAPAPGTAVTAGRLVRRPAAQPALALR
jgi:two-component system, OmpR family, phosphate regulon response regulator PhoB